MRRLAFTIVLLFVSATLALASDNLCPPGWDGTRLITADDKTNWDVEADAGSFGQLSVRTGYFNKSLRFDWELGEGRFVRAVYRFDSPLDLTDYDIFGLTLKGDATSRYSQRLIIMFADADGTVFSTECDGLHLTERWLINQALPKLGFSYFFRGPNGDNVMDWSHVTRFYVGIQKHDAADPPDMGKLRIDELRADRAADWERPRRFTAVAPDAPAAVAARDYILSQERATGLYRSWKGEWPPTADLYEQALALMVFTREGMWDASGRPQDRFARAADRLAHIVNAYQLPDNHWPRTWNPDTGLIQLDDAWEGDQAWWIMASTLYAAKSGSADAEAAAAAGSEWLRMRVPENGLVVDDTQANTEVWWALMLRGELDEATAIARVLGSQAWDADVGYWYRGVTQVGKNTFEPEAVVAMGTATMTGALARTAHADSPRRAHQALGFVRRALSTETVEGELCGFDGLGPVSLWNDGMGQYVTLGGMDADLAIRELRLQQRRNGSLPGSPEDWYTQCQSWLTTWSGLAPTAWYYFALTGSPFPDLYPIYWRDPARGVNALWLMHGPHKVRAIPLATRSGMNWEIVGTGDFDGDLVLDLLWRNRATGANMLWLMAGDEPHTLVELKTTDTAWRVGGVGDVDRDGDPDIFWQRGSVIAVWIMDGIERLRGVNLEARLNDDRWLVSGAGDFDADSDADLMLRHRGDGRNAVWFLEGTRRVGTGTIRPLPDLGWTVGGVGDLDADGDADLLWRHTSGVNALWTMNGTELENGVHLEPLSSTWEMVGPR